jgi:RHS repeat-associated protein
VSRSASQVQFLGGTGCARHSDVAGRPGSRSEGAANPGEGTMNANMPMTEIPDYRARYYDPAIGRFISEDPIGFRGGRNFYAYVGNNPILFRDPSGLCYTAWDKGVIIATFCLTGGDPDLIPGPEGPTDSTDSPSPVNGQNPTHSPGPDGGALALQIANCIAKVLALPSCDTKPCKPSAQGHVIPSH